MIELELKLIVKKNGTVTFVKGKCNRFSEIMIIENISKNRFPIFVRVKLLSDSTYVPNYIIIDKKLKIRVVLANFIHAKLTSITRKYIIEYFSYIVYNKKLYSVVGRLINDQGSASLTRFPEKSNSVTR